MKKVYYAHSMKIYGTPREINEFNYLKMRFRNIINPSIDIVPSRGMERYLKAVDKCSIIVCSEYQGHIGKGVFEEIRQAIKKRKKVLCLRKKLGVYKLLKVKRIEISDPSDWFVSYGKVEV